MTEEKRVSQDVYKYLVIGSTKKEGISVTYHVTPTCEVYTQERFASCSFLKKQYACCYTDVKGSFCFSVTMMTKSQRERERSADYERVLEYLL